MLLVSMNYLKKTNTEMTAFHWIHWQLFSTMKSKGYCKKKKKDERSHYAEWLETKMTEKMSIDKCKIMHMTIIKLKYW